jgi:AcrR family transcriptional regulator
LQGFFVKMTAKRSPSIERKQRSDAQQNRERILAVARKAFTKSGANTSLEDVAKQAGVGIGTLYRHFSSREELLKAVYNDVTEKLAKAGQEFAETLPPVEALRAWMMLFVDFIAEKQIIAPALNALVNDPRKLIEASYSQTWETVRALVKRAIKSGDIRKDLDAIDLLRALVGVANLATTPDWKKSARKLVEILILGSRPVK